jgi:thioredoxin reductase
VPEVDERMVSMVTPMPGGFEVTLADGGVLHARTVALAVGVMPFTETPAALRGLDASLVSHSSDHGDLDRFRGMDVTVVGGGQAALETATLLAEQGTATRVLARADRLHWNATPPAWQRPWWQSARSPHSGLGCGWRNWFYSERPGLFGRLPEGTRTRVARSALGPAGAWWVRERFEPRVEVLLGHGITAARPAPGGGVRLETADGSGAVRSLETGHVVAATGFRATRDRLVVLEADLRVGLTELRDGSPAVGREFESSCPGLFMAGLVTASGFGPAMRFVHGAGFTASTLVRGVGRRLRSGPLGATVPAPSGRPRSGAARAVTGN